MDNKQVYSTLGIDKDGNKIVYNHSEFVKAVDNLNKYVDSRIKAVNTKITKEEGFRKLKKLYANLDAATSPVAEASTCRKGCGHCCKLLVLTSRLEKEYIEEYLSSHFPEKEIKEFKDKINKNKELLSKLTVYRDGSFEEKTKNEYLSSRIPCAFLDENQNCSIYEARPFICRKYIVFNSPEVCAELTKNTTQYYSPFQSTVKDSIIKLNQLIYGTNYEYKHLLSWFIENDEDTKDNK